MVVTLELQLQVGPAGGDTAHVLIRRLGGVIKHSSLVFLIKHTQVFHPEFTLKPNGTLQRKVAAVTGPVRLTGGG